MSDRNQEMTRLFDLARDGDEPPPGAEARLERSLAARLALGAGAATAASAVTSGAGATSWMVAKVTIIATLSATVIGGGVLGVSRLGPTAPTPSAVRMVLPPATEGSARTDLPGKRGAALQEPLRPARGPTAVGLSAPDGLLPLPSAAAYEARRPEPPPGSDAPSWLERGAIGLKRNRSLVAQDQVVPGSAVARFADSAPESPDSLTAEAQALRRAHHQLRAGSPERALALLDEQERQFARGEMAEERAAERVLSLCAAGQPERARAAAADFRERWPRSPLLGRVASACAE